MSIGEWENLFRMNNCSYLVPRQCNFLEEFMILRQRTWLVLGAQSYTFEVFWRKPNSKAVINPLQHLYKIVFTLATNLWCDNIFSIFNYLWKFDRGIFDGSVPKWKSIDICAVALEGSKLVSSAYLEFFKIKKKFEKNLKIKNILICADDFKITEKKIKNF